MEAFAMLLNTLVSRILFGHFTMFLVFLFVGFAFIPPEWALYLNSKTPAFFPDWFTLANFGSFVLACVATMIWILFCNVVKWLWKSIDNYCYPRFKRWKTFRAWRKISQTLSEDEWEIVHYIFRLNGVPAVLHSTPILHSLIGKGCVQIERGNTFVQEYILTPSFQAFLLTESVK